VSELEHAPGPVRVVAAPVVHSRYRGCLLGGAVGDALGAPVEFLRDLEIRDRFGPDVIRDYAHACGRLGAVTDDTQMTLFTADGMMRAYVRASVRCIGPAFAAVTARAYRRWLMTQDRCVNPFWENEPRGWLIDHAELFSRRAPGRTCLSALRSSKQAGEPADNDSKGCGAVMRVAPVGMFFANWLRDDAEVASDAVISDTFRVAVDVAALTHGHPRGQLPAGVFSTIVALVLAGSTLQHSVAVALRELRRYPCHSETLKAIDKAGELALTKPGDPDALASLGEGWVADEALAISVYCALGATGVEDAIVLSVNHSGDSDSTGALTGNLLGALLGVEAIPSRWLEPLELREPIAEMADDLATVRSWLIDTDESPEFDYWWRRYPGR
jgi:ADP-ribosylglycohydrolase